MDIIAVVLERVCVGTGPQTVTFGTPDGNFLKVSASVVADILRARP